MAVRKAQLVPASPAPVAQPISPQHPAPPAAPALASAALPDQDRLARLARLRVRIAPAGPGALPPPLPASWLVRGLLPAGSVALLVGDSAARKTYLMLHLALHVSQGLPWLGHPVRPAPVLYFDEDLGAPALRRRLALLARGLRLPALPGLFTASFNNWRFPAEGERDLLHYLILERRAGLVVLDPLSGLAPFGLEDDPRRLLQAFDQLRHVAYETGVAVVLIHHLNKRGAFRGVSHLKALADVLLHVHSEPLSPVVHLEAAAMRGAPARRFSVRMEVHPPSAAPDAICFNLVAPHESDALPLRSAPEFVLAHLALHGPADRSALHAAGRQYTPAAIDKALYRLHRRGLIHRFGRAPTVYRLAPE